MRIGLVSVSVWVSRVCKRSAATHDAQQGTTDDDVAGALKDLGDHDARVDGESDAAQLDFFLGHRKLLTELNEKAQWPLKCDT